MSLRDNPLGELKVPLTWTAGIVFIVVFIASVAILLTEGRKTYDTDANGQAQVKADLPPLAQTTKPLKADVVIRLREPSGRALAERTSFDVKPAKPFVW